MFYIIKKFECVSGIVNYTIVGYVTTKEDAANCIDESIISNFGLWVEQNIETLTAGTITASSFLEANSIDHFYLCDTETTNIDGQGLREITDFINIEGV